MFESTLPFNLTLLVTVAMLLYIVAKALMQAWQSTEWRSIEWQSPNFSPKDLEGTWGWWIKLRTARPNYLYYFGPFSSVREAESSKLGYIQDLAEEDSEVTTATILWCRPRQLTCAQSEPPAMPGCA
jgi:hypothetical protein